MSGLYIGGCGHLYEAGELGKLCRECAEQEISRLRQELEQANIEKIEIDKALSAGDPNWNFPTRDLTEKARQVGSAFRYLFEYECDRDKERAAERDEDRKEIEYWKSIKSEVLLAKKDAKLKVQEEWMVQARAVLEDTWDMHSSVCTCWTCKAYLSFPGEVKP